MPIQQSYLTKPPIWARITDTDRTHGKQIFFLKCQICQRIQFLNKNLGWMCLANVDHHKTHVDCSGYHVHPHHSYRPKNSDHPGGHIFQTIADVKKITIMIRIGENPDENSYEVIRPTTICEKL
jgi:hypothetical protein